MVNCSLSKGARPSWIGWDGGTGSGDARLLQWPGGDPVRCCGRPPLGGPHPPLTKPVERGPPADGHALTSSHPPKVACGRSGTARPSACRRASHVPVACRCSRCQHYMHTYCPFKSSNSANIHCMVFGFYLKKYWNILYKYSVQFIYKKVHKYVWYRVQVPFKVQKYIDTLYNVQVYFMDDIFKTLYSVQFVFVLKCTECYVIQC